MVMVMFEVVVKLLLMFIVIGLLLLMGIFFLVLEILMVGLMGFVNKFSYILNIYFER